MKNYIKFPFILSLIQLASCQNFTRHGRLPASTNDCTSNLQVILNDTPTGNSWSVRGNRSGLLQKAVDEGNVDGILSILKKSHDNIDSEYVAGTLLEGRNLRQEGILGRLSKSTRTTHVPAYFQRNDGTGEDVYSTIFYAADGRVGVSNFEEEAMSDIKVWISSYKEYWNNLKNISRSGTESKRIMQYIDLNYLKGDISEDTFPRDLRIPFLNDQGEVYNESKTFVSLDALKNYRDLKEQEFISSFAVNLPDDVLSNSDLYREMLEQALRFRRLELVYKRLTIVGSQSLDVQQRELIKEIRDVLEGIPDLRPRSDMVAKVQTREVRSERKAKWRFWRSKNSKDKYPLPSGVKDLRDQYSPTALATKYIGLFAASSLLAGGVGALTLPLEELPQIQYFFALLNNYKNDFLLSFSTTTPLLACAKSERAWTLNEAAMNDFLKAHTSRYNYLARFTDYDENTDEELEKYKQELRVLCIKERNDYRVGERHQRNKDAIPTAMRAAVDSMLIDTINDSHENASELVPLVEKLLHANWVDEDKSKENEALGEIARIDPSMVVIISDYLSKVEKGVETLQQVGSIPKYNGLEGFIESLDNRYD
jgi:hypothetical protein